VSILVIPSLAILYFFQNLALNVKCFEIKCFEYKGEVVVYDVRHLIKCVIGHGKVGQTVNGVVNFPRFTPRNSARCAPACVPPSATPD
jgi:hypothetical protein